MLISLILPSPKNLDSNSINHTSCVLSMSWTMLGTRYKLVELQLVEFNVIQCDGCFGALSAQCFWKSFAWGTWERLWEVACEKTQEDEQNLFIWRRKSTAKRGSHKLIFLVFSIIGFLGNILVNLY